MVTQVKSPSHSIKINLDSTIKSWAVETHGAKLMINDPIGMDKYRYFYLDVETDEKDNMTCLALCPNDKIVYWFSWPSPLHSSIIINTLKKSRLGGQNVKGDIRWLVQNGIPVSIDQVVVDTQLQAYVQASTKKSLRLKDLAKEILGWEWPSYKYIVKDKLYRQYAAQQDPSLHRIGKRGNKLLPLQVTMDQQPDEVRSQYNSMDALSGMVLANIDRMVHNNRQKRYFQRIELPVMKTIYRMEEKGIKLDIHKLEGLHKEWMIERNNAQEGIIKEAGKEFNPNSPKQVLEQLKKRGHTVISSNAETLSGLTQIPFVNYMLTYRKFFKLTNTYSGPLLEKANADPNDRIHASFNQVAFKKSTSKEQGIRTGRLSCSNPNLQNIHGIDEDADEAGQAHPLRYVFIPGEGMVFVGSDYSQIEYRILAHESQEPTLLEAYYKGYDVHTATAAKIFDLQIDKVTKDIRLKGKTLNFAIVYGAGPAKIAQMSGCTFEEAKQFIFTYYSKLPGVRAWKQRTLDEAKRVGGVETMFGRFIPIPEVRDYQDNIRWKAERQVIDYRIQGSAADIMKMGMIRLDTKHSLIPVLSVHDEIVLEVKIKDADRCKKILQYELENTVKLSVPVISEATIGKSWGELK